ncbi:hypothetical protein [Vibrio vulnificus]|uniref:hypothetical protein n=1 Tax=Vibrio vulnificus TaxID=672 RepID=UPI001F5014CC|nr:hypothetical protein [Vibrio vulnificus]
MTDDQGATAETHNHHGDRHERCANSDSGDRQRDRRCEHHSSISAEDVDLPAGASLTFSTTSTAAA